MDWVAKLIARKGNAVKERRKRKYRFNANMLERLAGSSLDSVLGDMEKVRRLDDAIEKSSYAPWTKSDLRLLLKMLWKEAHGLEPEDSPKEIRWIKVSVPRKYRKHPKKISEEEFSALLKAAKGRDRAIIHLLYEAGLRPHELLSLKKSDLEFVREGVRIQVPEGTKTGARDLLVIDCEPSLAAWLAVHPFKSEDAPLFPSTKGKRRMSIENLNNRIIKRTAQTAGIRRGIKTYDFRHTAASRLAKILTDAQMKAYFGWEQDSKMAGTYVQMSGRDVDAPLLAAHGKKVDKEELEGKFEPKACKRCGKQNAHDAQMCQYCGMPVDRDKAKLDAIVMQKRIKDLEILTDDLVKLVQRFGRRFCNEEFEWKGLKKDKPA